MSHAHPFHGDPPVPLHGSQTAAARQAMLASIEASPREEADVAAQRARIAALHQQVHFLMQQPGANSGREPAATGRGGRVAPGGAGTPFEAGRAAAGSGAEPSEQYRAVNREAAKWSAQLRAAPEDKRQGRGEACPQDRDAGGDGVARQLALRDTAEASAQDTVSVTELRAEQARQRVKFQDLVSRLRSENARLKERLNALQERYTKEEQKAKEERANRVRFLEDEVKRLRKRLRSMEATHAREKADQEAERKGSPEGAGRTALPRRGSSPATGSPGSGGTALRERALREENQKLRATVDKVTGTARELARTIARLEAEAEDRAAVEQTLRRALEGAGVDDAALHGPGSSPARGQRRPRALPSSNSGWPSGGGGMRAQGPRSPGRPPPAVEAHLRAAIADRSNSVERARQTNGPGRGRDGESAARAAGGGAASDGNSPGRERGASAGGGAGGVLSLQDPEAEASSASVIGMPPSRVPPALRTTAAVGAPPTPSGGMSSPAALASSPAGGRAAGSKPQARQSARERAQSAFLTDMQNSAPPSRAPPPRPVREAPKRGRDAAAGASGANQEGSASRGTQERRGPSDARRDAERRGGSQRGGMLFETLASAAEGR